MMVLINQRNGTDLTPREVEVVAALVSCDTYSAVAMQLNICTSTVKWHVQNVRRKWNIATHRLPMEAVRRGVLVLMGGGSDGIS